MSKRKREETQEERWRRKLKKYEEKLNNKKRRIIYSSDDENDVIPEEHLPLNPLDEIHCADESPNDDQNMISVTSGETENLPIDPEILDALGDYEIEKDEWSENFHPEIVQRFTQILINGLKKEQRQELFQKYLIPKNSPLVKAPILNPEIGAILSEACKNRDKRFLDKQEQIGRALSALEKAMTALMNKDFKVPDIIRTLNDTGKLIADSHYSETESRRFLIIPFVDKSLIYSFKGRKRDNFLFGDKLDDLVKTSRGIKKTSQQIIGTPAASSSGNWKGPSDRGRQQRSGQPYTTRPGGQRATARGRAAPLPAHPPPQPRRWLHQPPLPPPATRRPLPPPQASHPLPPPQVSRPPPPRPRHRPHY